MSSKSINKLLESNILISVLVVVLVALTQTACSGLSQQPQTSQAAGKSSVYSFRDELKTGVKGPEMVVIQRGSFVMGDQQKSGALNEQVQEVSINQDYAIGKFEVTVAEFREFVDATDYVTSAEKGQGCYTFNKTNTWNWIEKTNWQQPNFGQADNHPVVCVSWHDAVAYTKWLSEQTGQQYRLPTEAEWEYVARAGTGTRFWWGNDTTDCKNANCCLGQDWMNKQTRSVGSYQANRFGVYDTVGNVWEWTASNYVEQYNGEEKRVAGVSEDYSMKTLRGGSWYNLPSDTRSSRRYKNWPQERNSTIGFRVVRSISPDLVNVALGSSN